MNYLFRHLFLFAFFAFLPLLLVASAASLTAHSGNRVYYTIEPQSDSTLLVRVTLHEHDLAGLLAREQACAPSQDLTICAVELIRTKMSVTINGTLTPMMPSGSSTTSHDVVLLYVLRAAPSHIRTMTIENTCFVTTTPKLENILNLALREDVMYSLTKDRTSITHTFKAAP
jgi:hypothetical protein